MGSGASTLSADCAEESTGWDVRRRRGSSARTALCHVTATGPPGSSLWVEVSSLRSSSAGFVNIASDKSSISASKTSRIHKEVVNVVHWGSEKDFVGKPVLSLLLLSLKALDQV